MTAINPETSHTGQFETIDATIGGEQIHAELHGFSEAKAGPNAAASNEDMFLHDDTSFILVDGSTPKGSDIKGPNGESGGRLAADIVARTALASQANGPTLITEITEAMRQYYAQNAPEALENSQATIAATLIAARIVASESGPLLVVTHVGDGSFRINQGQPHTEERQKDVIDAADRAAAIKKLIAEGVPEAEAVPRGREAILDSLNSQHALWNNPDDPLGFGYINGHPVPSQFVHQYSFPLGEVTTLEMASDGYAIPAAEATVASWEAGYQQVQATDPYRYKDFPATKPNDDRTVAIISFSQH